MSRPAHCPLYLLCSQKRERKKLIPLCVLFIAKGRWSGWLGRLLVW